MLLLKRPEEVLLYLFMTLLPSSQSASVRPLPYMEGVIYMRSDFLHEHGSTFSVPETFLIPILGFYNELSHQPHVFHV